MVPAQPTWRPEPEVDRELARAVVRGDGFVLGGGRGKEWREGCGVTRYGVRDAARGVRCGVRHAA
jgi:hypothetical protein